MDPYVVVFVSAGSEKDAATIAKALVEERLAACVNIIPKVRSIYLWEGKICDDAESYLIIKTRRPLFRKLQNRVKALHTYDVPEIIGLPIVEGFDPYLGWIEKETEGS
jgi:periplasmic divalent cation tolerance protein